MKKAFALLFFFLPLFGISQNITDSLLLHYPFDNNVQDISGNNFHGTANGVTIVADRFGNPNSAYYFDGVNDYIDFPLNDTLKPNLPVTIAYWLKLKDLLNPGPSVATDFINNNYHGVWSSTTNSGLMGLTFGGGIGGTGPHNRRGFISTILPLDTGIWYHITLIVRSAYDMEIWVNCKNSLATGGYGTGPLTVGKSNNGKGTLGRMDNSTNLPPNYSLGYLDDLMYWKRALTVAEIVSFCESQSETWNCESGTCTNPGNGTGAYTSLTTCLNACKITPSWDCINGNCTNPGNGTGLFSSLTNCQHACRPLDLNNELFNSSKRLVRITDVLGREVLNVKNEIQFYIYDDGTVEKKITIED